MALSELRPLLQQLLVLAAETFGVVVLFGWAWGSMGRSVVVLSRLLGGLAVCAKFLVPILFSAIDTRSIEVTFSLVGLGILLQLYSKELGSESMKIEIPTNGDY